MWFKIDASQCNLCEGDWVTPESVIVKSWDTGETVRAGVEGQVKAISFSGADHALIVLVKEQSLPDLEQDSGKTKAFKVEASRFSLQVGDFVIEGQPLGEDFETGEMLRAEFDGQVRAVTFSGADHALIAMIRYEYWE